MQIQNLRNAKMLNLVLCYKCQEPMHLRESETMKRDQLKIVFECIECKRERTLFTRPRVA